MADEDARPDAPVTSTSIVLLTLAHTVEAELGKALEPLGLTVSRLGLLGHIAAVPGISFSALARMSGITVQSAHTAVKTLTHAGLVHDTTARAGAASAIEVTPEGRRTLDEAMLLVAETDRRLFGPDADPFQRQIGASIDAALDGVQD